VRLCTTKQAEVAEQLLPDLPACVARLSSREVERARRFYRVHRDEIIGRMRRPTTPSHNTAAVFVALFETDRHLRSEALQAVDAARRAREARQILDMTVQAYGAGYRLVDASS